MVSGGRAGVAMVSGDGWVVMVSEVGSGCHGDWGQ